MRLRILAALLAGLALAGCREVRVKSYASGDTIPVGTRGNQIAIVRSRADLERYGLKFPVRFNHEFGVILLMGPHPETGWHMVVDSIRANEQRVRIVAFEKGAPDGGQPTAEYHTYTLWIVPNSVYRRNAVIDVVTPDGAPIASTTEK